MKARVEVRHYVTLHAMYDTVHRALFIIIILVRTNPGG